MQRLLQRIAEFLRLARLEKRWKKLARVLAIAVVFCTTYMLILPAITMENEVYCGLEEHVHSAACYASGEALTGESESGTGELVCDLTEHSHGEKCYIADEAEPPDINLLDKETKEIVQFVIDGIDALPTTDEIEEKISEFEQNGDEDGETEYLTRVKKDAAAVNYTFSVLGKYQKYVTNSDKLYDLEWLWSAYDLGLNSDGNFELDIYAVNDYSGSPSYPPVLIYGGNKTDAGISDSFLWWTGFVVECDSNGKYYVSQVNSSYSDDKSTMEASTANGFVVFIWSGDDEVESAIENIAVGDEVLVDFNYRNDASYSGSALGTVTFGDVVADNDELHTVESAYTKDLIDINLFNYGTNINTLYSGNNKYPGFQQDYGTRTTLSSIGAYNLNFGNTVTADILAGINGLTTGATGINKIVDINGSLEGTMSYLLGDDGYPVTADNLSLAYLFTENTYATKQNDDNITGLFQQNDVTGEYYYDSHLNHAQFDAATDTFILYKEKISANFMMYPFGNFLPFTDIENDATQSSKIDGSYLTRIAQRSYNRYLNGESKNSTDEYLGLYNALTSFVKIMNNTYTGGWSAEDCANLYFEKNGVVDASGNYVTFENSDLEDIYTLDYDIPTDFYFGMEMELNFIQPKGGLTGTTGQEPLVFYFTGDDDVWIYIDGVLFLDLSGIHRHVGGKIDFVNGLVYYYKLDTTIGDVSSTPYKTETFAEILERAGKSTAVLNENGTLEDYTQHNLRFFYMERGSGSGVCRMNFNLPLVKDNTISITKELEVEDGVVDSVLGGSEFNFQVLRAVDGEKTDELFIAANTTYDILNSAGTKIREGTTDANGIITLKAGETAVIINPDGNVGEYYVRELIDDSFEAQYGQVYVDGKSVTTVLDVVIGEDHFYGFESGVKDILAGQTAFTYNNVVDPLEFGALKLTKELNGGNSGGGFTFSVNIDGSALPVDTPYTLISSDGTETEKTVTQEGEITLKAGESALIGNLLAGSSFSVTENTESKGNYTLSYKESGTYYTTDGDTASGVILPASTAEAIVVTAVNSERGTSVTVPGTKTLSLSDGNSHTYSVVLQQVTDETGSTLTENGTSLRSEVVLSGESGTSVTENFSFSLNFYDSQTENGEYEYYYRIFEESDESLADSTDFDESVYVAKVTLTKTASEFSADVTAFYKNGELTDVYSADFVNTLIGDVTVSKEVEGEASDVNSETDFEFRILLTYSGEPLSGSYTVIKTDASGAETESDLVLTNGGSTLYIAHNEKFSIKGLPVGTQVRITEISQGFQTSYTVGDSETRTQDNTAEQTVSTGETRIKFLNHVGYVLPETGGIGSETYIIGGLLTSLSAVFLLCCKIRKGRRRKTLIE